jgi:hypothetical protein
MSFIPPALAKTVARQALILQKNSPRILFVAGVVGGVTSTVMACKATLKLNTVLDDVEYEVKEVKRDLKETDSYNRDLAFVYAKGAVKLGRLYGPSVVLGAASIGALTGSHVTLTRRNAGLTAAYAAISRGFDEYRDRVRDELGQEKEQSIYSGTKTLSLTDENGKKIKALVRDPNQFSIYAKIFDAGSRNWQKNPELNRIFLQSQQNYFNHILQARGHVFLNEVYDALDVGRTKQGAVTGWVWDEGDNFIDFGMFEARNANFIDGFEMDIILDFNVDGVIYDLI